MDQAHLTEPSASLLDGFNVGYFQAASDGRLLKANPCLQRLLDVEVGGALPASLARAAGQTLDELLRQSPPQRPRELLIEREGREPVWLRLACVAHESGFEGLVEDISERRAVLERERNYRQIVENIDRVFFLLDEDKRFIYISPSYETVWGVTRDRVYQDPLSWLDAIHPEDRERVRETVSHDVENPIRTEYRIVRPDGQLRYIVARAGPLRDESHGVRVAGYAEDVTEARRARESLSGHDERMAQAQKMESIGRLAGGIAHDFNNMLTAISGYCDLMLNSLGPEDALIQPAQEIRAAAARATALTRQLLAFSRKQMLQPRVLELNGVVANIEKVMHRLIGEHIDLRTTLEPNLGRIKADPGQLEQVLLNLAVNARDAMPKGGRLDIETSNREWASGDASRPEALNEGRYVVLAVHDTGTGMDKHTAALCFEPFFTTRPPGMGTGLGLSTVYGIVQQSGGHVDVETQLGHGSTFRIYMPRVEDPIDTDSGKDFTSVGKGNETILLVEDEELVRKMIRMILKTNGYDVLVAADPEEALKIANEFDGRIHLMVTDVVMPKMNGEELARRLCPLRPKMKVLYMSGYTDHALVRDGAIAPDIAFLQKPFKPHTLSRKVREVLDGGAT